MDSLSLTALADDLSRRLVGRRLGAVVVPRREQVAIGVPDGALFISIAAADARVHLIDRLPPDPQPEPSIQTHLDSILRAAEVRSVRAVDFDRVLRLEVTGLDRVGNSHDYSLIIELMGKHSAFIVLDGEGLIVATLKTVTRSVNRHRELLARLPYVPPPGGDRLDPLTLTAEQWQSLWPELAAYPSLRDVWRAKLFGLSNELWDWLRDHGAEGGCDAAWSALAELQAIVRESRWRPCILRNADGVPADAWPLPLAGGERMPRPHEALALVASIRRQRARRVIGSSRAGGRRMPPRCTSGRECRRHSSGGRLADRSCPHPTDSHRCIEHPGKARRSGCRGSRSQPEPARSL